MAPIELVDATLPISDLIATGLASRPETRQQQGEIWAAGHRVNQEHIRPWLPNLQVGSSAGNFGGGQGSNYANSSGRSDVDVLAVWEVENLGYGNRARRQRTCSELREATLRRNWVHDQIKSEIVAAASDVQGYREQIEIAHDAAERARDTYEMNQLKDPRGRRSATGADSSDRQSSRVTRRLCFQPCAITTEHNFGCCGHSAKHLIPRNGSSRLDLSYNRGVWFEHARDHSP